ncbi:DUF4169 family protein [Roseomonas elaeocarpi]|uniref:DUF4169 family protein n=1 Tax=Roseomonas elaeocarpi TaxID=907779 RepID=A0ABV6JW40_9PROT
MVEVINLARVRKAKKAAEHDRQAAANRASFGRTGAQKKADRAVEQQRQALLDGARLEPGEPPKR